jgi:hypothetical protein
MPISTPVLIQLSEDERAQLESWARRHTSAQALALRSRVVLLAAEGLNNTDRGASRGASPDGPQVARAVFLPPSRWAHR